MFSTTKSQRRAYVIAMLLCSILPAAMYFFIVGLIVAMVLGIFLMGSQWPIRLIQLHFIHICAAIAGLITVYRFWDSAERKLSNDSFLGPESDPANSRKLLQLLALGLLSALVGIPFLIVSWVLFFHS